MHLVNSKKLNNKPKGKTPWKKRSKSLHSHKPENYFKSKNDLKKKGSCFVCKKLGHRARECRHQKRQHGQQTNHVDDNHHHVAVLDLYDRCGLWMVA